MRIETLMHNAGIKNYKQLSDISGVSTSTIHTLTKKNRPVGKTAARKIAAALNCDISEIKHTERTKQQRKPQEDTICWKCANATPDNIHGCKWSRYGVPVDGWTAIKTVRNQYESYRVIRCPEFEEDNETTFDLQDEKFESLGSEVIRQAATDYRNLCEMEAFLLESDPGLQTKRKLYGGNKWCKWYKIEMQDPEIAIIERFFRSQLAELFSDVNCIYIMERIREITGLER